ncbi:hypothetical protein AGMMS50262_22460 [Bacteroidia bacterium]|nr:hypothetical protein AGMMS50262_22460 [Bacteroidia bacterium]
MLQVDDETNSLFKIKVMKMQELKLQNTDSKEYEIEIDNMIFDLYQLTHEERETIGFIEIQ